MDRVREFDEWLGLMEEAERGDGWLAWCESRGVFVAWNPPFIAALATALRRCAGEDTVLEVAAGDGTLARLLAREGVAVRATDAQCGAEPLSCQEALANYELKTVLSCFAPLDAGIEAHVTAHPGVERYLYIGPLINDRPGPDALWSHPGWTRERLPAVDEFLISRLDFLTDFTRRTLRRRAAALLLSRADR